MAKQRVYHWTAAIRMHHFVNLVAMVVLVFTGFYIHSPFMAGGEETMAWMRWSHLIAAYLLLFGLVARIYLMFNSREAADWKELLPLPGNLANLPDIAMYYLFIKNTHKHYERYNPLQALAYVFMGVMIFVMAMTGFALHTGWLHNSFAWVNALLGGLRAADAKVRSQSAWALGAIGSASGVDGLVAALRDADAKVRSQSAWALGAIGAERATSGLLVALKDTDPGVRRQAAWALSVVSK